MTEAIPVRKNNRGMTLVETVVALAIIFIVFLGLSVTGLLALDYNIKNAVRDEAVNVAETWMEAARITPFAALANDNAIVTRAIRNHSVDYDVRRTVTTMGNINTRQVVIDVTWTRSDWTPSGRVSRNYSHRATTIVRNR